MHTSNHYNQEFINQVRAPSLVFVGANDMAELFKEKNIPRFTAYEDALFIEADPEVFLRLEDNVARFNKTFKKNFKALSNLVTDQEDVSYNFNILTNRGQSSSIYTPNWEWIRDAGATMKQAGSKNLTSRTLSSILEENKWENKVFDLELDTQGAELDCLKGLKPSFFNHLISLVVEVTRENEFGAHYKGQPLFPDIDDFLTHKGFFITPPCGPGFHNDGHGTFNNGVPRTMGDPKYYSYLTTTVPLADYFDILPAVSERDYEKWHIPYHGSVTYLNKNFPQLCSPE
jgi:FkbM family methyltransferase